MFLLRKLAWLGIKLIIKLLFPDVKQLSTQELASWLEKESSSPLLLDGRTPEEYAIAHLPNALLAESQWKIDRQNLVATPIVTYCSVGYRSAVLARKLQREGYTNVFNLSGSIFQWFNEQRPLVRDGELVQTVHPYNRFWAFLLSRTNFSVNLRKQSNS